MYPRLNGIKSGQQLYEECKYPTSSEEPLQIIETWSLAREPREPDKWDNYSRNFVEVQRSVIKTTGTLYNYWNCYQI